jgi:hypothetical protein
MRGQETEWLKSLSVCHFVVRHIQWPLQVISAGLSLSPLHPPTGQKHSFIVPFE